jgi:hypothetical protein
VTTQTPVETATSPPPKARKKARASRRLRSRLRFRSVTQILGSILVAIGAIVIARDALGITGPLGLTVVGYLGFVVTMGLSEYARAMRPDEEIDLTTEETGADAPAPVDRADEQKPVLHSVPDDPPDVPMRRRKITGAAVTELLVAMLSATAFAELLRVVLRMRSLVGFGIWWYLAFVVVYFLLVRDRSDAERAIDSIATVVVVSTGILVCAVLGWMVAFIVIRGARFFSWTFFSEDLSKTGPLTPGGGAKHAIIGTLEQVLIATAVVVPIGIMTAVYLHEIHGKLAPPIRFIVDAMAGLPSIVAGLLIFTVWAEDHGFSGIAGSAALAVLMLPTMTRASEEILRTVPNGLR